MNRKARTGPRGRKGDRMMDIEALLRQYDEDIAKAADEVAEAASRIDDVAETLVDSDEFYIPEDEDEDW